MALMAVAGGGLLFETARGAGGDPAARPAANGVDDRRFTAPAAGRARLRAEADAAAARRAHRATGAAVGAARRQPDRPRHRRPEPHQPGAEHQRRPRDGAGGRAAAHRAGGQERRPAGADRADAAAGRSHHHPREARRDRAADRGRGSAAAPHPHPGRKEGRCAQSQLVDAEAELEGLRKRRQVLREIRVEPEVLRAPTSGVIAAARVVPGQVVQAQDVLFQIVDPEEPVGRGAGLWRDRSRRARPCHRDGARPAAAQAALPGLQPRAAAACDRSCSSRSRTRRPISASACRSPSSRASGEPVTALIVPKDAVVRSANGEAIVWRHEDAGAVRAAPGAHRAVRCDARDHRRRRGEGRARRGRARPTS